MFSPSRRQSLAGGSPGPNTVDVNGNLVVTGSIKPDYAFTSEYPLESIEDHEPYMREHRHPPTVWPGQVNAKGQATVNVGLRSQGMLKELAKAHIYLEPLHGERTKNRAELLQVNTKIAHLQDELTAFQTLIHPIIDQNGSAVAGKES